MGYKPKVKLDAGHGGKDTGAVGNGLIEKDLNLATVLEAERLLLPYDVEVSLTRRGDIYLFPDERTARALEGDPDLCISVHHNFAGTPAARGSEVIHCYSDKEDDVFATFFLDEMKKLGFPTRRSFYYLNAQGKDYFYMIRRIADHNTHAVITEGGFLSNLEDAKLLSKPEIISGEAQAIVTSAIKFLNLQLKPVVRKNHWSDPYFKKLKDKGVLDSPHDPESFVKWGEFSKTLSDVYDAIRK